MKIDRLIDIIADDRECILFPLSTLPEVRNSELLLPPDLMLFYQRCGGMELFKSQDYGFTIVPPGRFLASNPVILGKYYLENKEEIDRDKSTSWYIIAQEARTKEAVTLDLSASKNGYCYDSFHEVHATGNSRIVAKSFTELLERLYEAKGTTLYWDSPSFDLGCAYD